MQGTHREHDPPIGGGSGTDSGFTLIELLVVILIIGILASIAIPVYLRQRQKGYDAQAISGLRNLAQFEEIYMADFNAYGTIAQIQASEPTFRVSKDVTITVVRYDTNIGYCLSAQHAGAALWYYDSQSGGVQPRGSGGCPVAGLAGVAGDSMTG